MSFRRAARVDSNQKEIVKALRKSGWYVLIISQLKNCCDLIASKNGRTVAIEVKDGTLPPSKQKLTKGEQEFADSWQGEFIVITNIDEALSL